VALVAGEDYPGSYAELRAWFDEDWKCLDYLDWLRWPQGSESEAPHKSLDLGDVGLPWRSSERA
jgi:hypothetical protein